MDFPASRREIIHNFSSFVPLEARVDVARARIRQDALVLAGSRVMETPRPQILRRYERPALPAPAKFRSESGGMPAGRFARARLKMEVAKSSIPDQKSHDSSDVRTRENRAGCKERPPQKMSRRGGGEKSREFIPWCDADHRGRR